MELAHRLVGTRRGTLIVALVAALLAGAAIVAYVGQYRSTVKADAAPVTVLVAKGAIPKGTPGAQVASSGLFTVTTIRESQLVDGALSDPSALRGTVAAHDVYAGAQLTAADFAPARETLASSLATTQRVVSLPLDSAHGLIGGIAAGDRVDVFAGFNVVPLDKSGAPVAGGQTHAVLKLIVPDLEVVSVGGKGAVGTSTTNVTLRADDRQAAELAFASDNGRIWLALRPASGARSSAPSIVTVETLLLGVPPVKAFGALGGVK